jgi:hypothetical protein
MHKRIDRQIGQFENNYNQQQLTFLRTYLNATTIVPKIFGQRIDALTRAAVIAAFTPIVPTIYETFMMYI